MLCWQMSVTELSFLLCPRYFMLAGMAAFTVIGYPAKPDTDVSTWAKKKAKQELKDEGLEF
jgi:hypothetical protein